MTKIDSVFSQARQKNTKVLVTYVMAGFPNTRSTISAVKGMLKGGADIIELGFPFSDPLADGPVIQNASLTSINSGFSLNKFFDMVRAIRKFTDVPLVLMTYSNIFYKNGFEKTISRAARAGIDGFIIPDLPIEESDLYLKTAKKFKCDTIFLISPNTPATRIKKIAKLSTGFLYMVAVYGTTGIRKNIPKYTPKAIAHACKISFNIIPLGVGFGIRTPSDASRYVSFGADAIIIGSALVKLTQKTPANMIEHTMTRFICGFRKSL